MSVSWLSSLGLVGQVKPRHLPCYFRSVRLSLLYHHDWKVSLEILLVGAKGSSSIRWRRSTAQVRMLILLRWPHPFCVGHSHISSDFVMVEFAIPRLGKISFMTTVILSSVSDQELSTLPYRPASSYDCGSSSLKAYQVVPCLIISWSLIIPSFLKPISNFVHLNPLVVCALWAIACHVIMSLPLVGFTMWVTSLVRSLLLILGVLARPWTQFPSPCVTALSLKRHHHEQASSWRPCELCLTYCVGTRPWVHFLLVDELSRLQPYLELCRLAQMLLKPGLARRKVSLPPRVAKGPSYSILSEWMAYYSELRNQKEMCWD
jgi:hypothetical protein